MTKTVEELREALVQERKRLEDYQDLQSDQGEDDAYIARGNGFCDAKYSDDFLEGQIESIRERIVHLEQSIALMEKNV